MSKLLLSIITSFYFAFALCNSRNTIRIRGGLVPQADPDGEYYGKFNLDYGCDDNVRVAGSLRGLVKSGSLSSLPTLDPFIKWLNNKLESGPKPADQRIKPFYAADFGKKKDLKPGENPKIMIVNRCLKVNKHGILEPAPSESDIEVREVWQPWLKPYCDFVVRYIVPNRANIVELMEGQGRFHYELRVNSSSSTTTSGSSTVNGANTATARMVFKPTLLQRLWQGKKDIVVDRLIDAKQIQHSP